MSLADVPLAEVLKRSALAETSGDLQVIDGRTVKTAYFDRGFVVFAASNLEEDRLGNRLVQLGRVSREEVERVAKESAGRRLGQALVDAGLMSEEELGRQVAGQVNSIVQSLFQAGNAIYSFDERPCIIPMELMVSLSIHRILLEGIRHMTSKKLILKGLPSLDRRLRIAERPPFTLDFFSLSPVEQAVHGAVHGGIDLQAIPEKVDEERTLVLRACYGLYAAGILEPANPADTWRPLRVQEETVAFRLFALEKNTDRTEAQNIQQEVLMEFDRLGRVTDEEMLGLYEELDSDAIETAYQERSGAWATKRELTKKDPSLASKIDMIQSHLKAACQRLQARQMSETSRDPLATAPAVIQEAPLEPARSGERIAEPHGRQPAKPPSQDSPAKTPSSETKARPAGAVKRDAITFEKENEAASQAQAGELLRDIKRHSRSRDWEAAVSLLFELVALVPDNAVYRGMLANAMSRHPVMRLNAERHFIQALRIEPQNAALHYCLGLYYKSFGMRLRAETAFRAALRIEPEHRHAPKHLLGESWAKRSLVSRLRTLLGCL